MPTLQKRRGHLLLTQSTISRLRTVPAAVVCRSLDTQRVACLRFLGVWQALLQYFVR